MILPQTIAMGTITRRSVESTWMTVSNIEENRVGSELKALIQAPKGYKIIGADVDSEELWISSLIGDSQFGFHGSTAMSWMTIQGNKSESTDMHSQTAKILKISRSDAKTFNYGRIYGAGLKFAAQLLRQCNLNITEKEASERAEELFNFTKGKRFASKNIKDNKNKPQKIPYDDFWYGGSESYMFNSLEDIAFSFAPRTPVLKCGMTEALKKGASKSEYMRSKINWVVQSSGVDYLHLLLVSMQYLIEKYDIKARFMISIYDEIRFLVEEHDSYRAALALQISNLWTRAMFSYMMGIEDLPLSTAFFSTVDIDHVLRKGAGTSCKTVSYDCNIENGETWSQLQDSEYKSLGKALDKSNRFQSKDRHKVETLKAIVIPWLKKHITGINIFLDGKVPTENLRFRDESLTFKLAETAEDEKEVDKFRRYQYPDMKKTLGDFDLTVNAGEFTDSEIIVMLGENGTGKTTFIRLLAGITKPDGEEHVPELNVSYKPQKISPKYQGTVRALFLQKIKPAFMHAQFQTDVVKPMQIDPIIDQEVIHLSGGELQRVAIVLALGQPADIYLIDEPSAYLDSEQRIIAAKVIKRFILHNKKTAFVVEHDFIMATYLADRVVVYEGQPSVKAVANTPQSLLSGMNKFLSSLEITFRRDPTNFRPRINKVGSSKDKDQKLNGNYFFLETEA
ncbi:12220_t:CDS:2 [Entrophospora sp. SA101]|nr:12220_t:CDS:2 [Entrophospora sp. SA101]